jgi:hypothetical protein
MKAVLGAFALALALPALALADPSTSPGYTAFDQAQFAKLAAGNGTWVCKDTPPTTKPDVVTGKQAGNWYVWSETGDQPNVTYVRWNHTLKAFTQVEVDQSGSSEVFTTASSDPFNATWKPVFPPGSGLYPLTVTSSGNAFTASGKYKDAKTGKVMSYTGVCTKS